MGKKKKKSGIYAKSSDSVRFRQRYPQAHLRFDYVSSNISFDKLDLNLFIAGELEIITDSRTDKVERNGRLYLLKKLMYLSTSYELSTIKTYYAAVLREIELGNKTWKDDFQYVEGAILNKHIPKSRLAGQNPFFKKSDKRIRKQTEKKEESDVWWCALYQRNKCQHKTTHTLNLKGKLHLAQHICATCWQKDNKKLEHPECSSACPHIPS